MIARRLSLISAFQVGLVLAVLGPVSLLSGQTNSASTDAAKPKPKMVPRGLPGMGPSRSAASQSGPSVEDIQAAEASARAKVPLFRPAAAQVSNASASGATASHTAAQPGIHGDRAKIMMVYRRGTFTVPQNQAAEAPVLVNGTPVSSSAVSTEAVPAALPPGKIRVIPKEMIKIGTPAPTP